MNRSTVDALVWRDRTGHLSSVIDTLRNTISGYAGHHKHRRAKIGVTNDPERRWREHRDAAWNKMIVLYSTTSLDYARRMEARITDHFNASKADCKYANERRGGGGRFSDSGRYYVYLLLARR